MKASELIIPYTAIDILRACDNAYQLRLLAWLLAKAQAITKNHSPQELNNLGALRLQYIDGQTAVTIPARWVLSKEDTNYKNIEKALSLAQKTIKVTTDRTTNYYNIITNPTLYREGRAVMLNFSIQPAIWAVLLDFSKGYRKLHLQTFLDLHSKPAMLLYFICAHQKTTKTYHIDNLKKILGATGSSYDRGNNFAARYLAAAQKQLDNTADWSFNYTITRAAGHRYELVTITPRPTNRATAEDDRTATAAALRRRIAAAVAAYLRDNWQLSEHDIEIIEPLILQKLPTTAKQLETLGYIREAARRLGVNNTAAYLTASLKNIPTR